MRIPSANGLFRANISGHGEKQSKSEASQAMAEALDALKRAQSTLDHRLPRVGHNIEHNINIMNQII